MFILILITFCNCFYLNHSGTLPYDREFTLYAAKNMTLEVFCENLCDVSFNKEKWIGIYHLYENSVNAHELPHIQIFGEGNFHVMFYVHDYITTSFILCMISISIVLCIIIIIIIVITFCIFKIILRKKTSNDSTFGESSFIHPIQVGAV